MAREDVVALLLFAGFALAITCLVLWYLHRNS